MKNKYSTTVEDRISCTPHVVETTRKINALLTHKPPESTGKLQLLVGLDFRHDVMRLMWSVLLKAGTFVYSNVFSDSWVIVGKL